MMAFMDLGSVPSASVIIMVGNGIGTQASTTISNMATEYREYLVGFHKLCISVPDLLIPSSNCEGNLSRNTTQVVVEDYFR